MNRFAGRAAIVTGAASGLGLAVAGQLASEGASLVLVDWAADRLAVAERVLVENGATVFCIEGDVSDPVTADAAAQAVGRLFGRLDVLINNAGIDPLRARSVTETELVDWDRVMAVNLRSAYLFSRAAIPLMKAAGGGSIVSTASTAGLRVAGNEAVYSVSKAAVVALTRSLALDFAADGIRANCVCPGFMEAVMTDRRAELDDAQIAARYASAADMVPLGRQGSYEEVAHAVLFLAGPESAYITGEALVVDGGLLLR